MKLYWIQEFLKEVRLHGGGDSTQVTTSNYQSVISQFNTETLNADINEDLKLNLSTKSEQWIEDKKGKRELLEPYHAIITITNKQEKKIY